MCCILYQGRNVGQGQTCWAVLRREIFRTKANVEVKGKWRSGPVETGRQRSKSSKTRSKRARGQHIRQNKYTGGTNEMGRPGGKNVYSLYQVATTNWKLQTITNNKDSETVPALRDIIMKHEMLEPPSLIIFFSVLNYPTWASPWWQRQKKKQPLEGRSRGQT